MNDKERFVADFTNRARQACIKATPHNTVEFFRMVRAADVDRRIFAPSDKMLDRIDDMMAQSVAFDFGDIEADGANIDFAISLLKAEMLRLPYPTTAIKAIAKKPDGTNAAPRLCFMRQGEDGDIAILITTVSAAPDGSNAGLLPVMLLVDHDIKNVDGEDRISWGGYHILQKNMLELTYGSMDNAIDVSNILAYDAIGYIAMLMNRNVSAELRPAEPRLNKSRAKKGRPPIRDSYKVKINLGTHAASTSGSQDSRNSPRPHWRRGHIRTVHTKKGDKLTPIPPTLVAADGRLIPKKSYVVSK